MTVVFTTTLFPEPGGRATAPARSSRTHRNGWAPSRRNGRPTSTWTTATATGLHERRWSQR